MRDRLYRRQRTAYIVGRYVIQGSRCSSQTTTNRQNNARQRTVMSICDCIMIRSCQRDRTSTWSQRWRIDQIGTRKRPISDGDREIRRHTNNKKLHIRHHTCLSKGLFTYDQKKRKLGFLFSYFFNSSFPFFEITELVFPDLGTL